MSCAVWQLVNAKVKRHIACLHIYDIHVLYRQTGTVNIIGQGGIEEFC